MVPETHTILYGIQTEIFICGCKRNYFQRGYLFLNYFETVFTPSMCNNAF